MGVIIIKAYIQIDGINSFYSLGLHMYLMDIESINEDIEHTPVEGRSGTLTERKGTYPDRKLRFGFDLKRRSNESLESFYSRIFDVEEWIDNSIGKELICFTNCNFKYLIKSVSKKTDPTMHMCSIEIEFICDPFRYLANEIPIVLNSGTNIFYLGTIPGECNIKIYGQGNVQLTINSNTIIINNINDYVELDSKLLECTDKDRLSKTRDMIGHFFVLTRGDNKISWVGNVSKIEILPRTAFK